MEGPGEANVRHGGRRLMMKIAARMHCWAVMSTSWRLSQNRVQAGTVYRPLLATHIVPLLQDYRVEIHQNRTVNKTEGKQLAINLLKYLNILRNVKQHFFFNALYFTTVFDTQLIILNQTL